MSAENARLAAALFPQHTKHSGAAAVLAAADTARADMQHRITAERDTAVCDELDRIDQTPWTEHVADVLLSLPGIAITDLTVVPEPDTVSGLSRWYCRLGDVKLHPGGVIAVEDSGWSGDHINARALAAVLLAAANAAEQAATHG